MKLQMTLQEQINSTLNQVHSREIREWANRASIEQVMELQNLCYLFSKTITGSK